MNGLDYSENFGWNNAGGNTRTTAYENFEILNDTLVLHELPAWLKSAERKPLASPRYYF